MVLAGLRAARKAPRRGLPAQVQDRGEEPDVIVLTPGGRFLSMASAARHHKVNVATVRQHILEGRPGWRYAEPYQIPPGALASPSWRPRERGTSENEGQP
jgi:hypothetical protein